MPERAPCSYSLLLVWLIGLKEEIIHRCDGWGENRNEGKKWKERCHPPLTATVNTRDWKDLQFNAKWFSIIQFWVEAWVGRDRVLTSAPLKRAWHQFSIKLLQYCQNHNGQLEKKTNIKIDAAEQDILFFFFNSTHSSLSKPGDYITYNATWSPTVQSDIRAC